MTEMATWRHTFGLLLLLALCAFGAFGVAVAIGSLLILAWPVSAVILAVVVLCALVALLPGVRRWVSW